MADEFVDLYEVIELPIDADRTAVRKRVNELYLEAQRNLDHRDFKTRVKYQELFEVTLPQARYILLDEGRRDDYDRIVRGIRAAKSGAVAPAPAAAPSAPSGPFKIEGDNALPGQNTIEPIPTVSIDPEKLAAERDELWKKWKSGLEDALAREKEEDSSPKTRVAQSSPVQNVPPPPPKPKAAPKTPIKFDFDGAEKEAASNQPLREGESPIDPKERERRLKEQRLAITKEMLESEGLKGMGIGASIVAVPGVIAIVVGMRALYPLGEAAKIPLPSALSWLLAFVVVGAIAFFTAKAVSKSMRRKKAQTLSLLSHEQLLKLRR